MLYYGETSSVTSGSAEITQVFLPCSVCDSGIAYDTNSYQVPLTAGSLSGALFYLDAGQKPDSTTAVDMGTI